MTENTSRPSRRNLITGGSAIAAAGVLAAAPSTAHAAPALVTQHGHGHGRMPLSFGRNGKFKIVQFNDTQDGPRTDRRTIELMNFFHFDGAEMTLRHITLTGVRLPPSL